MRHTKHEHQCWWHVRHRLRPSRPTNEFLYSQWRMVPRGNAHNFLELIGSVAADYTPIFMPIVNYLGIAGGIVKRATTIGQAARLGSCEPPQRPWERHGYGRWSSDIMRIASQHRYEATREAAG
jgi:hypothetical protein